MKPIDLRNFKPPDAKSVAKATAKAIRDAQPPLRVTVEWGTRLVHGARLLLLLGLLGTLSAIIQMTIMPGARGVLNVTAVPLTLAGAWGMWLLITPNPEDPSWLARRRWLARGGVLLGLAYITVKLICIGLLRLSVVRESLAASAHGVMSTLNMAACAGGAWYMAGLADALKDRFMRRVFRIGMWLSLLIIPVTMFNMLFAMSVVMRSWVKELRPPPDQASSWGLVLFVVALCVFMLYINFRLLRRLRRTLQTARELASSGPQDAPDCSQGDLV